MHTLAPLSTSLKAGSRCAIGEQTQHLDGMPCGVGPSTSETVLLNSSEGPERVDGAPSLPGLSTALSVSPMEFHAQHFMRSSERSDGRGSDVWVWFWPVESKESPTPLEPNEPFLDQRPKSPAIACRLCWREKKWQAYKLGDGTVTTLRNHLNTKHHNLYKGVQRTDAWEMERKRKEGHIDELFHLAGFLECLLRWIVSDDQASSAFTLSSIHWLMIC